MTNICNTLDNIYTGKMAVYNFNKVKTGCVSSLVKTLVYDNIPCLLTNMVSHRSVARDVNESSIINQGTIVKKIFLRNSYDISQGSYVEVLQNGRLYKFEYSGESFLYSTHQELIVETTSIA